MPRHLITLHTYGSWMPDRPQGFFDHADGNRPTHIGLARHRRATQRHATQTLDCSRQRDAIDAVIAAAAHIDATLYAAATEPQHLHLLLGWPGERPAVSIQRAFKTAITRALQTQPGSPPLFTRGGHRRRIRDAEHFGHVRDHYLPSHTGVCYDARTGFRDPRP